MSPAGSYVLVFPLALSGRKETLPVVSGLPSTLTLPATGPIRRPLTPHPSPQAQQPARSRTRQRRPGRHGKARAAASLNRGSGFIVNSVILRGGVGTPRLYAAGRSSQALSARPI